MPVTKSAKKKLRKDKKREKKNLFLKRNLGKVSKQALKNPTPTKISEAVKIIDKSAKLHLIHSNKAARLKSKLAKLSPHKKGKKRG